MSKLSIRNIDEAWITIDCDEGISYELREAFTFEVPGAKFSPQYRSRLWDGKVRLWNTQTRRLYRGLAPKVAEFAEERDYEWSYDNEVYDEEFSVNEAEQFIKTLNLPKHIEVRDYQLQAFIHAIRTRRTLLLSPTASGKSLIIYLITRYLHDKNYSSKSLIIVPTISLVAQLASDFVDYGFDSDKYIHKVTAGVDKQSSEKITIITEVGSQYTFDGNEDIKILNSNVLFKKAKDITTDDEIDDRWLQEQTRK